MRSRHRGRLAPIETSGTGKGPILVTQRSVGVDAKAAFGAALVCASIAALADNSAVAWLLSPIYVGGCLYAAARAPLRYSLYVLAFCALALEKPNEMPVYLSPLAPVGAVMFLHLKHVTGLGFLFLSGMEYMLIYLVAVTVFRNLTGSKIDARGRVPTPRPLVKLAYVSLAGSLFTWVYGLATGGDFSKSLWQLEKVIYVPIVFLLCHQGFQGKRDHLVLGKVLVTAALLRAGLAVYIVEFVGKRDPVTGESLLAHATSHHDSMLFASAVLLLILTAIERADKRALQRLLLLMPFLVWGMLANNRRMVWVQIGLVLFTLFLVTPSSPVKRKLVRTFFALTPVLIGYVIVGWNSSAKVFGPVQTARSVIEPETDASSLWREIENYDILFTFRHAPFFGLGYGHPFWEIIPLPAVPYDLEFFVPHNSILGTWAFAGLLGFTTLTLLWGAGVFFAMRAYYATKSPRHRVMAMLSTGTVIIYMIQCYGDMGLGAWTGVFLLGPSLALAGKLAVANGAWKSHQRQERASARPRAARPAAAQ